MDWRQCCSKTIQARGIMTSVHISKIKHAILITAHSRVKILETEAYYHIYGPFINLQGDIWAVWFTWIHTRAIADISMAPFVSYTVFRGLRAEVNLQRGNSKQSPTRHRHTQSSGQMDKGKFRKMHTKARYSTQTKPTSLQIEHGAFYYENNLATEN